ncbi:MAG: hypothetical protein AAGH46_11495, partial [Bacteroidota bacterium]
LQLALLSLLVVQVSTAQITEKDLEGVEFLEMQDEKGGTIYGFSKGNTMIGANMHQHANGMVIYTYFNLEGLAEGTQFGDIPSTGKKIMMEMKDNVQHGNTFKMTGSNVDYAKVFKKGKEKKVMHDPYKSKLSNRERCIGNCIGGFGLYQTSSGKQTIIGFFDSTKPESPVIHVFESGSMYEGDMKNWDRQGFGKYTWASDGSYYVGSWKKGKRHGLGIWFNKDGSIRKKGFFKKDELIINM